MRARFCNSPALPLALALSLGAGLLAGGPVWARANRDNRAKLVESNGLRAVHVREADGGILSYRHLAASTDVQMRGTRLAPSARIRLKIGSRPGFVELDINRGGITGLVPAARLGKDFLTYVLWAVSVDGRASNLGEITFEGDNPVPVNVSTPYQTFWLMVTAEPNYAVADPSTHVVLFSVKQPTSSTHRALPIRGDLFYFTHYAEYDTARGETGGTEPNQLLQARKAVQLASTSGVLANDSSASGVKEEAYANEALAQARAFLAEAETAYRRNPRDQTVVQFARTAAQSAENARALAMGAVGGLLIHGLESEVAALRAELARVKAAGRRSSPPAETEPAVAVSMAMSPPGSAQPAVPAPVAAPVPAAAAPPLVKQPALWFAVAGWTLALVLLFRQRSF